MTLKNKRQSDTEQIVPDLYRWHIFIWDKNEHLKQMEHLKPKCSAKSLYRGVLGKPKLQHFPKGFFSFFWFNYLSLNSFYRSSFGIPAIQFSASLERSHPLAYSLSPFFTCYTSLLLKLIVGFLEFTRSIKDSSLPST